MSTLLQKLTVRARQTVVQPEVYAARCVHTLAETASCRACVDACPRSAWVLDEEMLGVDTGLCDGCGLCAPACPEGAIASAHSPARRWRNGRPVAVCACERAGVSPAVGVMPCVHAVGVTDLLRLYQHGVRELIVATGECRPCPRGPAVSLQARLDRVGRVLRGRGLEPLQLVITPPAAWSRVVGEWTRDDEGPQVSRRQFFRRALGGAMDTGAQLYGMPPPVAAELLPPGKLLGRVGDEDIVFFAPQIDAQRCVGCDACARLCPHHAISLTEGGDGLCYRLEPDSCTGCGLCRDVCRQQAVRVELERPQEQREVALQKGRCRACGVPYHVPVASAEPKGLCPVCRQACHARKLYQVQA